MALLGSRVSVNLVTVPSAVATIASMLHELPTTPDRIGWTWNYGSAPVAASGAIHPQILSANATRIIFRSSANTSVARRMRIWAECIHSLVR